MNKLLPLMILLTLALSACGTENATATSGTLTATAQIGSDSYSFKCDPTKQSSSSVSFGNHTAMTCPSSDQKATLTILIDQVASSDGKTTSYHANGVVTVGGPPLATYTAKADLNRYVRLLNTLSGEFTLYSDQNVSPAVKITGDFDLSAN